MKSKGKKKEFDMNKYLNQMNKGKYIDLDPRKFSIKFCPKTNFWVVETNQGDIIRELVKRYGSDALMVEVIADYQKKFNKKKVLLI